MTAIAMNRTAIVTGGSRGLGRAVAADLAAHGWTVVVDGRDEAALAAAAEAVGTHPVAGDVTDPRHRAALVARAHALGGRVDLLVNNAGGLGPSPLPPLADLRPAALAELLQVNVLAPLALAQLALPHLRAADGAVVSVTSDAAVEAYPGWGGYGTTKAALEAWTRVLAVEEPALAVWSLDPGDLRTRMHQEAFPGEDISDRPEPEAVAPAVRLLVSRRPASGRVRAAELLAAAE